MVGLMIEAKFRIEFPGFKNMQGFFDVKETGLIFGTEDFDVCGRVECVVRLQEVSGKEGFFWVIFGLTGIVFAVAGFKGSVVLPE